MNSEWTMPRRSETCGVCGTTFDAGTVFVARLYEDPAGYARRDFCLTCPPPELPIALATWRTRRPQPQARKAYVFDREAVLGFFMRLNQPDTAQKIQFRFVLALLLWRKRVLKFDRSDIVDECEVWRFSLPASGERFEVQRPELDETEIESLSAQLEQLLAGSGEDELSLVPSESEPANA